MVRVWIFVIFGLQLCAFIIDPIARPGTFRLYHASMWDYSSTNGTIICDGASSQNMGILGVLIFFSTYFNMFEYSNITWTYLSIVLCFAVWQIYLFVRLLSLAERAQKDLDVFHGFLIHVNLFNYFSKGIAYLLLWVIEYSAYTHLPPYQMILS